jgi:hypothetical protein
MVATMLLKEVSFELEQAFNVTKAIDKAKTMGDETVFILVDLRGLKSNVKSITKASGDLHADMKGPFRLPIVQFFVDSSRRRYSRSTEK